MSKLSQYQSVFRVTKRDVPQNATEQNSPKRNRQPVACHACRPRKLRCDRKRPCLACLKRGEGGSCSYASNNREEASRSDNKAKACEAQLRLQRLEKMVTELIRSNKTENIESQVQPQASNIEQSMQGLQVDSTLQSSLTSSSGGYLNTNGSETQFHGATHWSLILENIRGIQDVLELDSEDSSVASSSASSDAHDPVIGTNRSLTLSEVLTSLPPKYVMDELISGFFGPSSLQSSFIHRGKFMKTYELFWVNPLSVSFIWISMLFSTLYIASHCTKVENQDNGCMSTGTSFCVRAGQALVTGKYHRARPSSVEAVLLYAICKYLQNGDSDPDAWMICGIGARLALRMGYHRDPRHFPSLSPFDGEMRRRTFSAIQVFELLLSFQAGLPPIIQEEECDTEQPRYLYDEDFDEDCKVLPPSRPPTDPTPILFLCFKARMATVFRRILRHALCPKPMSYVETMQLDTELHRTHADIPPSLKMIPIGLSTQGHPWNLTHRFNIELLYQKSLCVLHRRYLSRDRLNASFAYSRRTCIKAALQILKYQHELHLALQPESAFRGDQFRLTSIVLHDFLMAAMITCLDLYEAQNESASTTEEDRELRQREYDALQVAHGIWTARRKVSQEASRASNVLTLVLSKITSPESTQASPSAEKVPPFPPGLNNDMGTTELSGESSDSQYFARMSWSGPGHDFPFRSYSPLNIDWTDSLNVTMDISDPIDWSMVNQYLSGSSGMHDMSTE